MALGTPQVRSFTEKIYTWKAGDNYDSLSQNFYFTKDMAAALKTYNKNHLQATDNVRADHEPLPGERIYIPPVALLDAGDLAGKALSPIPAIAASNTPLAALPTYKVTQENTWIMNVASERLKNGERWRELRQLNPEIDPERVLPIGTIVRLPADAAVAPGGAR